MSNENLTIQELADIVSELNDKVSDTIYNSHGSADYTLFDGQPICELITDGYISHIKLLGMYVWNSEDDPRPCLYNIDEDLEETTMITLQGEEARISMRVWLLAQVRGVQYLIEEFNQDNKQPISIEAVENLLEYVQDFKDCDDTPDINVIIGDLGEMVLRAKGEY